uniref:Uncharacterized protein n=1 Tax=Nelumbo nucifera TaxID=4432 RepID=A0A822YRW0_NELNU|nr:TPA_asm: hypothetical protein HUJ06_004769 [Nelumbo nucifera]
MTAPNMATITASLERSLQNFSLNHDDGGGGAGVIGRSATSDATDNLTINADTTVELNSHVALPYQWEQCLDLKVSQKAPFGPIPSPSSLNA